MRKGVFFQGKTIYFIYIFSPFLFLSSFLFSAGFFFFFEGPSLFLFLLPARPGPFGPLASRSPAAFQRSGTEGAVCAVDSRSGDHERPPFHVVFLLLSQPTTASTSTPADVAGGRLSI